jgi:hypothetical protein
MATVSQELPQRRIRKCYGSVLAAGAITAALLGSYFFIEMNNPTQQERWRWVIGAAVFLTGGALAFGRDRLRAAFWAPLIGLFVGMAAVVMLGVIAAAVEWKPTARFGTESLRSAVLTSLPAGAAVGAVLGLIGWLAHRLIFYRATTGAEQPSRPFQFGLRSLLFAVFALAVLLWIAAPAQRSFQQQLAVSRLLKAGAQVQIDARSTRVTLDATATDDDLEPLRHLPELKELVLHCPRVTDRGLGHLQGLPLQSLCLFRMRTDGHNVSWSLHTLTSLSLVELEVSDKTLAEVSRLPKLKRLWLQNVTVSDAALGHLTQATTLRYLYLYGTKISDAGLAQLESHPSLKEVHLCGTRTTKAGAQRLQNALRARDKDAEVRGP